MTAPSNDLLRLDVRVGTARAVELLRGIEERLRAPFSEARVASAVVERFRMITAQAFDTEGASTAAGAWPELAENTVRARARLMARAGEGFTEGGPAHPILQRSARLRRALTTDSANSTVTVTPQSLRIQISPAVGYFVYHQSTAPRKRLPRRAPVSMTVEQQRILLDPVRSWVTGGEPNTPQRPSLR